MADLILEILYILRYFIVFLAAVAIICLVLYESRRSFYQRKIMGMQTGMVTLMADIVENRDDNTGGHIKRTARYVEGIVKELKRRGRNTALRQNHGGGGGDACTSKSIRFIRI